MIESLIDVQAIRRRPLLGFLWSFLITSVAVIVAYNIQSIPGVDTGFFAVLFTIIPSVYFLTVLILREERSEEEAIHHGGIRFWETHGPDILILLLFFFGIALSFSLWSFLLPDNTFLSQVGKINEIRGTGAVTQAAALESIFMNNLQVMGMAFVFSLVFGTGAIFIIVWNASVLGVFIGQFSRAIWEIPIVSISFLPHGIPEIGGYLAAALAGGILSAAVLRNRSGILKFVLADSLKLLALGLVLIAIGAGIEVLL